MKLFINEEGHLIVREMSESDVQEFNLIYQGIAKMLVVKLHYFFTNSTFGLMILIFFGI